MGLTKQSTGTGAFNEMYEVVSASPEDRIIALAGNPNTGKSTVFNSLTGMNQHTGNWPGKTVTNAQGLYRHGKRDYILVDLPGTYSLLANSTEEQVARDFILFGGPHATVVVTDATCLERNLNLVLQILEITPRVVVCVNLLDEAARKKISVDLERLSVLLGVPVVGTTARDGKGLDALKDTVAAVVGGELQTNPFQVTYGEEIEKHLREIEQALGEVVEDKINRRWVALRLLEADYPLLTNLNKELESKLTTNSSLAEKLEAARLALKKSGLSGEALRDHVVSCLVGAAEEMGQQAVSLENQNYHALDRKIDRVLTSRLFGIPIMIALLGLIFWITIEGANVPSKLLADGLFWVQGQLGRFLLWLGVSGWVHDILVLGVFQTLAWVVAVMLPPMAIFFPLFTLLEDLGYLPRIAFNLDHYFKRACAHGKQALTMCMGFGCNAAGVIGARIIDSPRERLIAILTNNFVPCNGRFPTLIALSTLFIAAGAGAFSGLAAMLSVLATIILGVLLTLLISRILSKTLLKGLPSSFTLELPPYRKPQIGRIIIRSIFDRTLFVLGRAVAVAAPAGLVIWVLANVTVGDQSLLTNCAQFLNPFAQLIGLDGYILMAFILGLPANEIVIPILIMSYLSEGAMLDLDDLTALRQLLIDNGWTWVTALCTMLFSLNHWPCGTTLWTIHKETQSLKWTFYAFMIPTVTGIVLCLFVAQGARLLGLV